MDEQRKVLAEAVELLDQQSYRQALEKADHISSPLNRAAILIDAGKGAGKSGSVREGVALLEELLADREKLRQKDVFGTALYNVANGYYAIYDLRRRRRGSTVPPNDDELRLAKKRYRQAIDQSVGAPAEFRSKLFTNYGNCLSQLGRGLESVDYFESALAEDARNGVAAGNAGRELYAIAGITGAYTPDYIELARRYLSDSLSDEMHLRYGPPEVEASYSRALQTIEEVISQNRDLHDQLSPAGEPNLSEEAKEYISFCRDRSLMLNAWVGDPDRAPANSDQISFGPIVTDLGDDTTVPEMIRILNEIKEAYSTARYLLFTASRAGEIADEISRLTLYFRTGDRELNSLHIGLCKSSYIRAFDVLDKIARIVNVYFDIGRRDDHFWYMFAKRQSQGQEQSIRFVAPPEITKLQNFGLYALSDICIDYFESQHVDLKTIDYRRNLISHDYLVVVPESPGADLNENVIDLPELFDQTLVVLRLARLAILYAVNSIAIAEGQKPDGPTLPHYYGHDHGPSTDDIPKL